ncbi:ATP-binding protein [Anaeromyxobacter oryzisoli]|uniref:ATP-binding protein n=1 Tax=Anaeromyxobacter oryzisoli TaxID=2925408 RepID=UPI001F5644B1|nr:ATP-binding protein [Anaeromyxobacter sp. SG63]
MQSLRTRMAILVLVALTPGLLLLWVASRSERAAMIRGGEGEVSRLARHAADQQARNVAAARGLLAGFALMRPVVTLDAEGCQRLAADVRAQVPELSNVGAATTAGVTFCNSTPGAPPLSMSDRPHFQRALAERGFAAGDYQVSRLDGAASILFGHAIVGPDGAPRGVAYARLSAESIQRQLQDLVLPPGAVAYVTDGAGRVLAGCDLAPGASLPDPLARQLDTPAGEAVSLRGPDGVARLYAFETVREPSGTAALRVVVGLPTAAASGFASQLFRRSLAVYGAIALLAILALALADHLLLVRRLEAIVAAARRLSRGEFSARTGVVAGGELGELARTFDELAASLEGRRRLEEDLRQAQKMEAVGQLAGGIAHDFNNLLTAILGAGQFAREAIGDHPAREDLDDIVSAARRGAELTRRLLSFSRRQVAQTRLVDVGAAIVTVEGLLRRLLREDVALAVHLPPERCLVRTDPALLEQALLNLAVNAQDAMPGGGALELEVRAVPADAPERRRDPGLPAGPLVAVSVRDTGAGMDEATRARAFEPFFTTKPAGKGTGLGLSTVYAVVQQAGGVARVESLPGQGTTFRLWFPRAEEASPSAPPPAPPPTTGRERVLLVEDDPAIRGLARRALSGAGYRVVEADRPSAALAAVATLDGAGGRPVDLLVTDVILPGSSGPELAASLAARFPGLRVLFVSGYTGGHLDARGVDAAGRGFLAKPFGVDVLVARVREVLDAPPPGDGGAPADGATRSR